MNIREISCHDAFEILIAATSNKPDVVISHSNIVLSYKVNDEANLYSLEIDTDTLRLILYENNDVYYFNNNRVPVKFNMIKVYEYLEKNKLL